VPRTYVNYEAFRAFRSGRSLLPTLGRFFLPLFLLFVSNTSPVFGLDLTLGWKEASPDASVTGFILHYGTSPGEYSASIDVGNVTQYTLKDLKDLEDGQDYFFAVTAYNDEEESSDSREVHYIPVRHNHRPTVEDMVFDADKGSLSSSNLKATDTDGDPLEFIIVCPPTQGTLVLQDSSTGAFTYVPDPNATGSDMFLFKTHDGFQDSNLAIASANIMPSDASPLVDSPPAVSDDPDSVPDHSWTQGQIIAAINVGGTEQVGEDGVVYQTDAYFSGGTTYSTDRAIEGSTDVALYQTRRVGDFSYNIPVANGVYQVTLSFAETYWNRSDQRVFDVQVEGEQAIDNLDLFDVAGRDVAYDFAQTVEVTDGQLDIAFRSQRGKAQVCGILVQSVE
jgi:hypothetical protein